MATRTQAKPVKPMTAADIQKGIKARTNFKVTLTDLAAALGLGKIKGADTIAATVDDAIAAFAKTDPTFKEFAKAALDEAKHDRRERGAKASRAQRMNRRAPRDGLRILPGDFKILREVQKWVIKNSEIFPANFEAKTVPCSEPGKVTYLSPGGKAVTVSAIEFGKMRNGKLPWKAPQPSRQAISEQAAKLTKLSFIGTHCSVCGKPIKEEHNPMVAVIHQLLYGRFVVPYIDLDLKPGQMEARFRHNHLACSLIEDQLAKLFSADPGTDLAAVFDDVVAEVLKQAQAKKPTFTLEDVLDHFDDVMAYLEKAGN